MKKILLCLFIISIICVLFGCAGPKNDFSGNNQESTASPEPTAQIKEPVVYSKIIGDANEPSSEEVLNINFKNTIPAFSNGWSQTAKYELDSRSATNDGSGSMKFTADPKLEGNGLTHWFEYNFQVYEGRKYSVTFCYAGLSGGTIQHSYVCGVSKRANDHTTITKNEYNKALIDKWELDWDNMADDTFYRAPKITFVAEETAIYSVFFQLYGLHRGGTFWIDDIKVVESTMGETATVTLDASEDGYRYVYEVYNAKAVGEMPEPPEKEGMVFGGWYDEKGYLFSPNEKYTGKRTFVATYFNKKNYEAFEAAFNIPDEIPSIIINTDGNAHISSKHNYIGARITIDSIHDQYDVKNMHIQIRGRGNSSWYNMEKHSYRLKLDEKTKILGMHSDRNFALVSNHDDKSLLRNFLAYGFANSCDGLDWTPECHYVNLTLNGDFRGLYLLVETVREDNNRVVLDGTPEESRDRGFLIEQVPQGRMNDNLAVNPDEVYIQAGGFFWNVKYPEREDFSSDEEFKEERKYIRTLLQNAFDALNSKYFDKFSQYWDVDSFVDFWLLEELFKNFDAFQASIYISKPMGGKLTFGPAWDFDLGVNNVSYVNLNPEGWYLGENSSILGKAMRIPQFREMFFERIKKYYKTEWKYYLSAIDTCAEFIEDDWNKNYERWSYPEKVFETPQWILNLNGYPEQVEFIKTWLNKRMVDLYNEAVTKSGCESWPVK